MLFFSFIEYCLFIVSLKGQNGLLQDNSLPCVGGSRQEGELPYPDFACG